MSRGLVLAGGGAKGAYAFGCLQAFRDRGIHFDRVAGASVGALNAAIWSAQGFDVGERLWRDLSFTSVLPVRDRGARLPRFVYYVDGFLRVGFRMMLATWAGTPHPLRRPCALINSVLFTLPFVLAALFLPSFSSPLPMLTDRMTWTLISVGCGAFMALMLYVGQVAGDGGLLEITRLLCYALASIAFTSPAVAGLLTALWPGLVGGLQSLGVLVVIPVVLLFVVLLGILPVYAITAGVALAARVTRGEVFANTRLRYHIADLLTNYALRIPTYVCVAERKAVFSHWHPSTTFPGVYRTGLANMLARVTAAEWVPHYVDIRGQPVSESADMLLASASLPFGLLPCVRRGAQELVDGGVADNVPVFPLLDRSMDEIFIVFLDDHVAPDFHAWADSLAQRWSQTDLLRRQAELALPPESIENSQLPKWGHLNLQPRQVPHAPRVVAFWPSKPLGGFLRGTLNFDSSYAQRLMALGRADAERALSTSGRLPPSTVPTR